MPQDCSGCLKEKVSGYPMFVLSEKMKTFKARLKEWNKCVFGDVNIRANVALQNLDSIQQEIDANGGSDLLFDQEKAAQLELQDALHNQEEFWLEKSRLNWNIHGD